MDVLQLTFSDTQKKILYDLRYQSFLSYNELWNKKGDSSKFAYHLRVLEKEGLVEKTENGYTLSLKGIQTIDYLSMEGPQPLIVVLLIVEREGKVLIVNREKQPYKGHYEFCASKIKHGESIIEAAKDRLVRKLGLQGGVFRYCGIEFMKTKEKEQLLMHHHLHVVHVTETVGKPEVGRWIEPSELSNEKIMPHLVETIKIMQEKGFSVVHTDLIKEGKSLVGYNLHSFDTFN